MPHDRFEWHERIGGVEKEFRAARLALDRLRREARLDPAILRTGKGSSGLSLPDAIRNAEGTYSIRMFAEFENALRSYWRTIHATVPASRDLLDGVAGRRRVPPGTTAAAHRVREYRNRLVHEFEADADRVAIDRAGRHLNTYLGRLPETWG
jgi:hypothetical protein